MIRSKHNIDTQLVNTFITKGHFDDRINEILLDWLGALGDKNHQVTRDKAIIFLQELADIVLSSVDYPNKERAQLINVFEPLELLLRTALALKNTEQKAHNVRDHLSHTVRNVLFTNYLLEKYRPVNNSILRTQLIIAAIFHDIAYPIEKLKKVANKIVSSSFQELLSSKGNIEIELDKPDDLLELLDFVRLTLLELEKRTKETSDKKEIQRLEITTKKVVHIYKEIICKAIAGKGLFDASHSISSVVLFLLPIVKYWKNSKMYQEMNLDKISDICLAMTYHDRDNLIENVTDFPVPLILRIMRISDELQEWDRESNSYIKDVHLLANSSAILSLYMIMKDKSDEDRCIPELFIPDKVRGLLPAVEEEETIRLIIEFPDQIKKKDLQKKIIEKKLDSYCLFENDNEGKIIELLFNNKIVKIQIRNHGS